MREPNSVVRCRDHAIHSGRRTSSSLSTGDDIASRPQIGDRPRLSRRGTLEAPDALRAQPAGHLTSPGALMLLAAQDSEPRCRPGCVCESSDADAREQSAAEPYWTMAVMREGDYVAKIRVAPGAVDATRAIRRELTHVRTQPSGCSRSSRR